MTSPLPLPPSPLPPLPHLPLLQGFTPIGSELLTQLFSRSILIRTNALAAVGDAFKDSSDTINVSPENYEMDGPDVGPQFATELVGIVAEATKRAQYILRSVNEG